MMHPTLTVPAADGEVLVIAEAGVNHNGDLGRARAMVEAAKDAGADIVKFQAFSASGLTRRDAGTAKYQETNTGISNQRDLLRGLELSLRDFESLAACCANAGVGFLCTPFDVGLVEPLVALGMPCIKVASSELTNWPALRRFARLELPVLLSTGMATEDEVGQALETLIGNGALEVVLLHCTSLYPAPVETINLRAIPTLTRRFARPVGYSDHTLGDTIAIAAVALGARVIEKHFTLDRRLPGPDHAASLEPAEFAAMVKRLRVTAAALGDGIKRPSAAEQDTARLVRRSWHTARALAVGQILGEEDLVLKRPADGLPPGNNPIGRHVVRALTADMPLRAEDLANEDLG